MNSSHETTTPGRVALVTGGTSGVGRATCILLASKGFKVITFGRSEEGVASVIEAMKEHTHDVHGMVADVSKPEEVEKVFKEAVKRFGSVDVLVNNAGLPANSILDSDYEEWKRVVEVNLLGYFTCAKFAVNLMKEHNGGHIINIGSLGIRILDNGADLYMAAKSGVHGFTHSLRKKLVHDNIKVTLINPGAIASGMVTENSDEKKEKVAHDEMLKPEDVAEAIYFCLSQPSRVDITELELRPHQQSIL